MATEETGKSNVTAPPAAAASAPSKSLTTAQRKKKKVNNNKKFRCPDVSQEKKSQFAGIIEKFRASDEQVYTFEANLSNQERCAVHMLCLKMGLNSRSFGKGKERRVSISKKAGKDMKNKKKKKKKGGLMSFTFSKDAKDVLQDLFTRYPPDDGEMGGHLVGEHSGTNDAVRRFSDDIFRKPSLSKPDIFKKLESYVARSQASKLRQITGERAKLPIASFKDVITSTIDSHQVVLISGETGCGKTTQVPQYILDHMWGKGETCKIVCTQPRRISAMSVAARISAERGENVGDTVGYKIRLESKGGRHSSIVFCTNGVLLRVLVGEGSGRLANDASRKRPKSEALELTHIIVDEIHERDRFSDFILTIIRDMLPFCPHLRLVLMSATIDAERFSNYFAGCPIISVPGFTHPVKTFYLEDVLSIVNSADEIDLNEKSGSVITKDVILAEEFRVALDEAIDTALSNDEFDPLLDLITSDGGQKVFNYQHSLTGVTPLMVFAGKGRVGDVCMLLSLGGDCHLQAKDGTTALDWAQRENQGEAAEFIKKHMDKSFANSEEEKHLLDKYLATIDAERIDDILIEQLLKRICSNSKEGAILVFLPGWDDINRTSERLRDSSFFRDSSKFIIIMLHSMVPSAEQKKVFNRPPPGCRKIILSTNISETAVTIDDVVYVIDSGRMKEKSYDPYSNVSTLHSSWISKASAKQREGRAGRCQPGYCYHLYSKLRAASLPDFQAPEINRMPLEELCLQVKLLDPDCKIEEFLRKTLDPPVYESIRNAIIVLQDIGALTHDEKLTELGEKLGSLPVHPLTSKMLLMSVLLDCLDPALTLACAFGFRDPFTLPLLPKEKQRADAARSELASLYGGCSDQLAVVAAFDCWKRAKELGQEHKFCSKYFVSSNTMHMILKMRMQLRSELTRKGFIPEDGYKCSRNARVPGILHAVLVAGLYPGVGRFLPNLRGGRKKFTIETANGDMVVLHPQSTNYGLLLSEDDCFPLVVYDEIIRGDRGLHIKSCSVIGPLQLLLLATEILVAPLNESDCGEDGDGNECDYENVDEDDSDKYKIGNRCGEEIMSAPDNKVEAVIDRWLSFASTALEVAQIYCLRERLSAAILFKVKHPRKVLPEVLGATVNAVACILSYDGMSGISLPSKSKEALASMVSATEISQSGPEANESSKFLRSLMSHGRHKNSGPHGQKGSTPQNSKYHHVQPPLLEGQNPHQWSTSQGPSVSRHDVGVMNIRNCHVKRLRGSEI